MLTLAEGKISFKVFVQIFFYDFLYMISIHKNELILVKSFGFRLRITIVDNKIVLFPVFTNNSSKVCDPPTY